MTISSYYHDSIFRAINELLRGAASDAATVFIHGNKEEGLYFFGKGFQEKHGCDGEVQLYSRDPPDAIRIQYSRMATRRTRKFASIEPD